MNDLISRQNAIDALKEYEVVESDNFTKTDPIIMMTVATIANCIEEIVNLPSVKPEPKWIPVSERLPEEGRYLVTRYDYVTKSSFIDILWFKKNTWWNRQITGNFSVVAWMPLPEPYRGE